MALQNIANESTLQLKLGITPAVGLLPADVTVQFRKQGGSLVAKAMDNTNFVSLGNGYYYIKWSAADMNTVGSFFFTISGLAFDTINSEFFIETLPQELVIIPPEICVISGNILDVGASPMRDMQVTFRVVNYPIQSGLSVISSDKVIARTDSQGNFSAQLIRGMTVVVEIERTGIRNQFIVPDAPTALLNDLIVFPVI